MKKQIALTIIMLMAVATMAFAWGMTKNVVLNPGDSVLVSCAESDHSTAVPESTQPTHPTRSPAPTSFPRH